MPAFGLSAWLKAGPNIKLFPFPVLGATVNEFKTKLTGVAASRRSRAVVLSHGHTDHTLGLIGILKRHGWHGMPIILHPDAFLKRKNVLPDGHEVDLPPPKRQDIEAEGINIIEEKGPTLLIDGRVLITGQIPRTTPFEKGFPPGRAEINGQWQPDPWIHDDQAIVINVRAKGSAVLTGCGHAGLINTLQHARDATGIRDIYAVMGGFHLGVKSSSP